MHRKMETVRQAKPVVCDIARNAGKILLDYQKKLNHVIHKADGFGLVTEADEAAEKYIIENLSLAFPGSSFLAEESGETAATENNALYPMRWIIDPLDGTNNYAHQFPWFCVSIGLEIDGEVLLGVIYQPVLDELFSAVKGDGALLNGQSIRVSSVNKLSDALLTVGFYYFKDTILQEEIERFGRVHQKALGIRRPGSAALDLAYLAAGRFDGYWERGLNPWDVAAGFLLCHEAGAEITRYDGTETDIYAKEVLVTNALLHEEMQALLR